MANPAAEEVIFRVQVEAVGLIGGDPTGDLLGQLGHDDLVGVNDQDPLVAERQVVQCPVLLLGVGSVEMELDDRRAVLGGDLRGFVGALAVHDEDLVGPGQRGQAAIEVLGLVLDGHDHADRLRARVGDLRGSIGDEGIDPGSPDAARSRQSTPRGRPAPGEPSVDRRRAVRPGGPRCSALRPGRGRCSPSSAVRRLCVPAGRGAPA